MMTAEELAQKAQDSMRLSGAAFRKELEERVYLARHELGVKHVLALVKELRSKALFALAHGSKDNFDANQATFAAWDRLVNVIEVGPKTQGEM